MRKEWAGAAAQRILLQSCEGYHSFLHSVIHHSFIPSTPSCLICLLACELARNHTIFSGDEELQSRARENILHDRFMHFAAITRQKGEELFAFDGQLC